MLLVKQNLDIVLGLAEGANVFAKGHVSLSPAPVVTLLAVPSIPKQ